MAGCIQEQVRNHPSSIWFSAVRWASGDRAALAMNSSRGPHSLPMKVIYQSAPGFNSSSGLCFPLWTLKIEFTVQNNWIKTFARINMFWQRTLHEKFIPMSSRVRSEGIYADSYEDRVATLLSCFGCYQVCFLTTCSVLLWYAWVSKNFW